MAKFSTVSIGFAIKISKIAQIQTAPVRHPIGNRFDLHANTFTLQRLPQESNVDFKKRIMDMTRHPGGPHYTGMINNLARELNAPRQSALTIDLKEGPYGQKLTPNPKVEILADRVVLYSDWKNFDEFVIDKEINIYDPQSEGYFLNDLVIEINTSDCFVAYLDPEVRPNLHSVNLIRGNNFARIVDDLIRNDQLTVLRMKNITEGSVWFSDKDTFLTEVAGKPSSPGEYHVDYDQGHVLSYSVSDGTHRCGYTFTVFPYKVDASLVHIYSLQDVNYKKKLFYQEVLQSEEEINALPNTEGAEVFHQLFEETEVFWGK